ncbi:dynein regulatory complex protein 8-like [Oscarella lobularis]|uniref:dynein regulatory complex protein 8-like n=1 Tax=Oscarella lobularis TaxID=121494 RepID=UPI0033140B6C
MADDSQKQQELSDEEVVRQEIQKKVIAAFDIFDHEANKTVDVREIGTIIRSLGCCPTESELHDLISEVEEDEPTGFIRYERFEPMMIRVLMERRYRPENEDQILKAFSVLDEEKKGYLTVEQLTKYMTEEVPEEAFSQDELEEMLQASVDPEKHVIYYKDYASLMTVDETA